MLIYTKKAGATHARAKENGKQERIATGGGGDIITELESKRDWKKEGYIAV
jgi:hypothetical protein